MDDAIPEVLITSSNGCSIYDATNSNEIASYKEQNTFSPKTLSLIEDKYLIGAYSKKPIIKAWTISKLRKTEAGNIPVPGIVSVLAVSKCGNYCIAGIKDQIYVWEIPSGELLMILKRHYQPVTCLKFAADDSFFFSGGKDGLVTVWILSCVIDVTARSNTVKPHLVWNKHSAEVTDIYSGFSVSRVASTSLDMTCNIYELDSGILLSTICMDVPLTCVVMDLLEYFIFLGDETGYLYKINTYERLPHEIHITDLDSKVALKLHDFKIISLSVSFDGTRLLTVSEDVCKLWHIPSMTCVLSVRPEGKLTNAFLAMKPACLTDETIEPNFCVGSFHKEISESANGSKCMESVMSCQELSLLYEGCPDEYICSSILNVANKPQNEEPSATTAIDDIFEEAIHGDSIKQVTKLNQQLFTAHIDRTMMNANDPPSPC